MTLKKHIVPLVRGVSDCGRGVSVLKYEVVSTRVSKMFRVP